MPRAVVGHSIVKDVSEAREVIDKLSARFYAAKSSSHNPAFDGDMCALYATSAAEIAEKICEVSKIWGVSRLPSEAGIVGPRYYKDQADVLREYADDVKGMLRLNSTNGSLVPSEIVMGHFKRISRS